MDALSRLCAVCLVGLCAGFSRWAHSFCPRGKIARSFAKLAAMRVQLSGRMLVRLSKVEVCPGRGRSRSLTAVRDNLLRPLTAGKRDRVRDDRHLGEVPSVFFRKR